MHEPADGSHQLVDLDLRVGGGRVPALHAVARMAVEESERAADRGGLPQVCGGSLALRITALMFVTIVIAAVIVDVIFGGLHLIPHVRPTRAQVFGSVSSTTSSSSMRSGYWSSRPCSG